ncbi:MAG: hypothetical protein CM1200mP2_28450 [Planctomycetaceae bacterium]|nr:MAG: hypothetical protein CM1200mP2_28450 [Planctomycetaceae bacterium]
MPSQQHDHDVSNTSPVPANDPDSTTPSVPAARTHRTWWIAGGAVVLALVGIQMLVTQPLARQLVGVRRNLIRVEKDMADLVGARDAIWETSDLLAGIQDQSDRLDATRTSIETIRDFREQVENAAAGIDETRGVVVQLSALQDRIVDESADHQAAMTALNRLVQLRDVAVTGVERTDRAVTEVTRLRASPMISTRPTARSNNLWSSEMRFSVGARTLTRLARPLINWYCCKIRSTPTRRMSPSPTRTSQHSWLWENLSGPVRTTSPVPSNPSKYWPTCSGTSTSMSNRCPACDAN